LSLIHPFDLCLITSSSVQQAHIYRQLIQSRVDSGLYPKFIEFKVVSDIHPGLGSGGAALSALYQIFEKSKNKLKGDHRKKRILLINAGGPKAQFHSYSCLGPLFIPLPLQTSSLHHPVVLDGILSFFLKYPWNLGELVISSAEVLLAGTLQGLSTQRKGIWGFAKPVPVKDLQPFGIYAFKPGHNQVINYFPKFDGERTSSLEGSGDLALDLGFLSFAEEAVEAFYSLYFDQGRLTPLAKKINTGKLKLNLYKDILLSAVNKNTEFTKQPKTATYSQKKNKPVLKSLRVLSQNAITQDYQKALEGVGFSALLCPQLNFYQVGQVSELLKSFDKLIQVPPALFYTAGSPEIPFDKSGGVTAFNSFSTTAYQPQDKKVFLENCYATRIDYPRGNNLFIGLQQHHLQFEIPDGICIEEKIYKNQKVIITYHYNDSFYEENSSDPVFCGVKLSQWLAQRKIKPDSLFQAGSKRKLEEAKIFTLWENDTFLAGYYLVPADNTWGENFCKLPRYSMQELSNANPQNLNESRFNYRLMILQNQLAGGKGWYQLSQTDFSQVYSYYQKFIKGNVKEIFHKRLKETQDPYLHAYRDRLLTTLENKDQVEEFGFPVQNIPARKLQPWKLKFNEILKGTIPIRADLAGGWTDTPPYTLEYGGSIINLAFDLDKRAPLEIQITPSHSFHIQITNLLTQEVWVLKTSRALNQMAQNGSYEGIIAKALQSLGFGQSQQNLAQQLTLCQGGLNINFSCSIPLATGLGAYTLFLSLCTASFYQLQASSLDKDELLNLVLEQEQKKGIGAGWQDVVGGLNPGVKWIYTEPGSQPKPTVHYLDDHFFTHPDYSECLLICDTGLRRNIPRLAQIAAARVLEKSPSIILQLHAMHSIAQKMSLSLSCRNWEEFLYRLRESAEAMQCFLPETVSAELQELKALASKYNCIVKPLGAGGGGFVLLACPNKKDAQIAKTKLLPWLNKRGGKIYPYQLNTSGLCISIIEK